MNTMPEAPETIAAQLEWLCTGKRKAVLIPWGTPLPRPPQGPYKMRPVSAGVLYYDTYRVDVPEILEADEHGEIGELLGYGTGCKPEEVIGAVTVRGPNGQEKQAVLASEETLGAVAEAARQVADSGDTVQLEECEQMLEARLRDLTRRELRVRPFDPDRDASALKAAAKADGHEALLPTHVIESGDGDLVGYFGLSSLPLYRVWLHSSKVKASDTVKLLFFVENHYRAAGAPLVATLVHEASPFANQMPRLGYIPAQRVHLYSKRL